MSSINVFIPNQEQIDEMKWINPDPISISNAEPVSTNWVFFGEDNGNYGNPTNYKHDKETRTKISKNNGRYWKGKTGEQHHAYGSSRPDNIERMHLLWNASRGKPSWNKGLKTGPQSEETKNKRSITMKGCSQPTFECPHCNKIGKSNAMKRWHFDNCKENI